MVFKRRRLSGGRGRIIRSVNGSGHSGLKRFVKGVVKRMQEVKWSTLTASFNENWNSTLIVNITPPFAQGTDKDNRLGNKIKFKMLTVRISFWVTSLDSAVDYFPQAMRVIIFQSRINLSDPPVYSDILDDTTTFLSTVKSNAVRVLFDEVYNLTPVNDSSQLSLHPGRVYVDTHFKVNNNVNFLNSSNAVPLDPKDTYYIAFISPSITPGQYATQGTWFSRMSFIDM